MKKKASSYSYSKPWDSDVNASRRLDWQTLRQLSFYTPSPCISDINGVLRYTYNIAKKSTIDLLKRLHQRNQAMLPSDNTA